MVDLMMWLVIAALLLAAAIQGIGYYQKAAYLYQIKSDLYGAGSVSMSKVAEQEGKITTAALNAGTADTSWSDEITHTVISPTNGAKPYILASHPAITDRDGIYLFDPCGDDYPIGVSIIPKGGDLALSACGITADPADGSGTPGTPTAEDLDGDGIPNASDPDIDGDGTPNESDTTPNGETGAGGSGGTGGSGDSGTGDSGAAPIVTVGDAIGRTSTLGIAGFGGNWSYELGDGTDTAISVPTEGVMQGPLAGQPIYMFSKNTVSYHSCAVGTTEKKLYCWGAGWYGETGDGTGLDSPLPVEVVGLAGKTIKQVSTGGDGSCAIADNTVYCWGDYWITGTDEDAYTAVTVGATTLAGKNLSNIVVGARFACVLADSQPYCWGRNTQGQLGTGDPERTPENYPTRRTEPTPVVTSGVLAGKTVTRLDAQNHGACAVADGGLYCWGGNQYGQLGDGSLTDRYVPVAVNGLEGKTVKESTGGYQSICAITTDGQVYCTSGQFGVAGPQAPKFPDTFAGKTVTAMAMGDNHTCAVASGQAYCWGGSSEWGDPSGATYETPQLINTGAIEGKNVLGLWGTASAVFVNYEK